MLEYEYYVNSGSDLLKSKTTFSSGFIDSFPIMTGYIPIAIAYGVIGAQASIPSWVVLSMSIFIYAGASQFMAINLFALNTSPAQMMITIGVINLRHLVMGLSFFNKVNLSLKNRIIVSLGLTDETFAILSLKENLSAPYIKGVMLGSYLSWIFGAIIGILFGSILPGIVAEGMEIAIFTLFITLLVNSLDGNRRLIGIPIISMITNNIASSFLPGGLSIILSIIVGSAVGMMIQGDEEDE